MADTKKLSDRFNKLLKGQTVEWARMDNERMITVRFNDGTTLYVDVDDTAEGPARLEISITGGKV